MSLSRKEIQRERMWHYFVNAASEIIDEVGIKQVRAKAVAERAGFTTSTIYNYFQEFSHVIFYAGMRYTKPYIEQLPQYMAQGTNTLEKWLYSWECFCKESFKHPEIYSHIFISDLKRVPEDLLEYYYSMYKNELVGLPDQVQTIVLEHTLTTRTYLYVQQVVDEGFILKEDVDYIIEATLLIWKGMLTDILNQRKPYSQTEAMAKTLYLIHETIMNVVPADKKQQVNVEYSI